MSRKTIRHASAGEGSLPALCGLAVDDIEVGPADDTVTGYARERDILNIPADEDHVIAEEGQYVSCEACCSALSHAARFSRRGRRWVQP